MTRADIPFARPVVEWFERELGAPTDVQRRGWPPIAAGRSALLLAPTGSGKTLSAFLSALDRLMFGPASSGGVSVVYVSPLKALGVDIERNLATPIAGISAKAAEFGIAARIPSIAVRSGDTPARDRARFRRAPSDILITTPESLYLLLTSEAGRHLASVRTVILDEVHAMVGTKRGAHLALSLERLERLCAGAPLQRIGLSATVRPPEEAAALLGGASTLPDGNLAARAVEIVDASGPPRLTLSVEVPVEELARIGELREDHSLWPEIFGPLLQLLRQHRSTLIFVNSRRLAERLSAALNEAAGEPLVFAHHGAVARDRRREIEDALKAGNLRALVATSSLELGIDMGAIDLVVQIEAPPSVASGLQRVGRAGHSVGGRSIGVIFPKFRGDLLAAAATAERMQRGLVESIHYPRNPLDVLAQQLVAIVSDGEIGVDELYQLVRGAAPFFELSRHTFEGVLDLLSGRYPSAEFSELKPRLTWDRLRGRLTARSGARRIAITNGGTIPDRGLYGVFLAGESRARSLRVGELDEEMVFESRVGDVFLLGASSWRIVDIGFDRVLVSPAPGEPGRMPFWRGDRPGRPLELGRGIGELCRELASLPRDEAEARLGERGLLRRAAGNLWDYIAEQGAATGGVPSDRELFVEEFRDELGDLRVCVLSPFGARVHAPWALCMTELARERHGVEVDAVWSDDGIVLRLPEGTPPELSLLFPDEAELSPLLERSLAKSSLFAGRFRENAARALLLPRRRPGQRTPLWAMRRRSADLLRAAAAYPDFPIVLETYRECLRDVFDVPGLLELLRATKSSALRVTRVKSERPSPFAKSLLFSYVGNFLYNGDAPLAERRAHALAVDPAELAELLGVAELRALLDPEALLEVTRDVARRNLAPRSEDELHELLLSVGDLELGELEQRVGSAESTAAWLDALSRSGRALAVTIAGRERFAAAEDAARLRDALGVTLPAGLPAALLEPVKEPALDLVLRFARSHGPFTSAELSARYGFSERASDELLERLAANGRVVSGEFLPNGQGPEWCDRDVLRRIKQKSLAKLRRAVEAVEPAAYGRLLLEWQGAARPRAGADVLVSVLEQLEGLPVAVSVFETDILRARVAQYRSTELDLLTGSGEFVFRALEPLGTNDARVAFYRSDRFELLAPPAKRAEGELAAKIRASLERRGASFFQEIVRDTGGFPRAVLDALYELCFSGEVSNDTLAPLRARLKSSAAREHPRRPGPQRVRPTVLPGSEGRWSLLARLRSESSPSPTQRLAAIAELLLERYGVLPREALANEELGNFSELYPVLKAMEDAGRVRRGYFIGGLSATQFARPGADDRLRILGGRERLREPTLLAATDPANPYGAILPWPEREPKWQRAAGAHVILRDGALIGYLSRTEHALGTCLSEAPDERARDELALTDCLKSLVDGVERRALVITEIDGRDAHASELGPALARAGFTRSSDGYQYRFAG